MVLLENIPLACRRNAPLDSAATPEEMRQLDSIGQKLRSLGFTIEAIETCLDASSEHGRLERSSSDLQGQLLSLFGELKPESLAGYLERLDGTIRPVSLPLFVTQKGTSQGRLQCRWHTLLPGVANSPELSARVRAALDRLLQIDQNDLALRILSAQLHFAANDFEKGVHSANLLAEMLEQVEKNTESKPFAGPLRNFTPSDQMALWLIARVCLEQPGSTHVGLSLGKRALIASGDPGNRKFSNAIRSEWERLAEDSSDPQTRNLLKQELSEIMRTRPGQFD